MLLVLALSGGKRKKASSGRKAAKAMNIDLAVLTFRDTLSDVTGKGSKLLNNAIGPHFTGGECVSERVATERTHTGLHTCTAAGSELLLLVVVVLLRLLLLSPHSALHNSSSLLAQPASQPVSQSRPAKRPATLTPESRHTLSPSPQPSALSQHSTAQHERQ